MNKHRQTNNENQKARTGMKKSWKLTSIIVAVVAALLIVAAPGFAQNNPITAVIDRTTLTTDDTLVLTVEVTGQADPPLIPYLDGFDVVATGSSTNISITNGAISSGTSYQYRLQPIMAGDLTIPAVSVVIDGVTYSTMPIAVRVTQGGGAAQPNSGFAQPAPAAGQSAAAPAELNGQDLYVEAMVDNPTPYQGETMTYIFRFYQAVNIGRDPSYEPPAFSSFWTDGDPQQNDYTVEAANRTYRVSEVQTTLAPTAVGPVTISPTRLYIPGSLFEGSRTLQTYPVTVDVQPWPQGAPADFKGAVGKFSLAAKVDATETKVNEPVTLQLVLSGEGNLTTAGDPVWTESAEWRAFDQQSTLDTQKQAGKISGQKVFERLLIPTQAGDLTIPAITYSYFNPETAVYETLTTDPIIITVAPGAADTAVANTSAAVPAAPDAASDIRAFKPASGKPAAAPLTNRPVYWLLWLVPLALVSGQIVYGRRQAYLAGNSDKARRQQAAKTARQALQAAQRGHQEAHAAAAPVFNAFLADKLGRAVSGLTRPELAALLQAQGVSDALVDRSAALLDACEYGRYAPTGSADNTAIWEMAAQLIDDLDNEL